MNTKKLLKTDLQRLIFLGIIVAMKIILGQFSVGPATVKVGLGFIGSVLLGYFFGPVWGTIGGGISDLVASAIFGNQGGFFIGFTLTAMVGPLIYALFLYNKPVKIWRIVVSTILVTIIVNIGMNTLWLHIMYNMNFNAALIQRLPKELIVPWIHMVIILSVSTATNHLSVALNDSQQIIVEKNEQDERNHSEHLDPLIDEILKENQLTLKDIDRFAVAIGPGSYTGLRIGITTVKMFASVLNKEVVGISTLQALAKSVKEDALVITGLDARNNNYFAAGYKSGDIPDNVIPDGHYNIDVLIKAIQDYTAKNEVKKLVLVGTGLEKQDEKFKALNIPYKYGNDSQNVIHAGLIGQLAEYSEPVDPDKLLPRYLRRTQAEVDWHKKTGKPFEPDSHYVEEV